MSRNAITALVALSLLALATPVAIAAPSLAVDSRTPFETPRFAAAADAKSLIGELSERDPTAKTFAIKSEQAMQRFVLASDAKVLAQGRNVSLADLRVGARLQVTYTVSGSTLTATRVEVLE